MATTTIKLFLQNWYKEKLIPLSKYIFMLFLAYPYANNGYTFETSSSQPDSGANRDTVAKIENWDLRKQKLDSFDSEFNKIKAVKSLEKDKYESDETYSKRLETLNLNKETHFYAKLGVRDRLYDLDTLGNPEYDPNKNELKISMHGWMSSLQINMKKDLSKVSGSFIDIRSDTRKVRSYTGSNALGVKKLVTKWSSEHSVLAIKKLFGEENKSFEEIYQTTCGRGSPCDFNDEGKYIANSLPVFLDDDSLKFHINIAEDIARKIDQKYGLVFVGNLSQPFTSTFTDYKEPSIDSPFEVDFIHKVIQINISELWLVDDKTKEILVKFRIDGNYVNPTYSNLITLPEPKKYHRE